MHAWPEWRKLLPLGPHVLGRGLSRFHYQVEVSMSLSHKLGLVVLFTSPIAACGEPSGPLQDQPAFAPAGNDNKLVTPIHIEVSEVCPGGDPGRAGHRRLDSA